jgi:hypothetical protein
MEIKLSVDEILSKLSVDEIKEAYTKLQKLLNDRHTIERFCNEKREKIPTRALTALQRNKYQVNTSKYWRREELSDSIYDLEYPFFKQLHDVGKKTWDELFPIIEEYKKEYNLIY